VLAEKIPHHHTELNHHGHKGRTTTLSNHATEEGVNNLRKKGCGKHPRGGGERNTEEGR